MGRKQETALSFFPLYSWTQIFGSAVALPMGTYVYIKKKEKRKKWNIKQARLQYQKHIGKVIAWMHG